MPRCDALPAGRDVKGTESGIDDTEVSDDSVPIFTKLKNLKQLSIRRTRLTDRGVAELQNGLPQLELVRAPPMLKLIE